MQKTRGKDEFGDQHPEREKSTARRIAIFVVLTTVGAYLLSLLGADLSLIGLSESGFLQAMTDDTDCEQFRKTLIVSTALASPLLVYWIFGWVEYGSLHLRSDTFRLAGGLALTALMMLGLILSNTVDKTPLWRMRLLLFSRDYLLLFCFFVYVWAAFQSFLIAACLRSGQRIFLNLKNRLGD